LARPRGIPGTVVALVLAAASLAISIGIPDRVAAYVPHPTILIVGDSGFTPGNGVTGGSGTPSDPYIIEGWEINASAADGIAILTTTAHFVIRNVSIHSGGWTYVGIWLEEVQNGSVEGSVLTDNTDGIFVLLSADVTLASNTITASINNGIRIDLSTRITLKDNDIQWNQLEGVTVYETT